jgi:hypothetical protein
VENQLQWHRQLPPVVSCKGLSFRELTGHLRPRDKLGRYAQNTTLVRSASHGPCPRSSHPCRDAGLRGRLLSPSRSIPPETGLDARVPVRGLCPCDPLPGVERDAPRSRGASVPLTDYPGQGAIAPLKNPLAGAVRPHRRCPASSSPARRATEPCSRCFGTGFH